MNQKHFLEIESSTFSTFNERLQRSSQKRARGSESKPLHCCIVDDHCDIVPFVIGLYRIRKLDVDTLVDLVHVDAHPDFSIPSSSLSKIIADWDDTELLYSILEEEGGISEFLIPLFARRLFQQMLWIRSEWADQFNDGDYNFTCFDSSNGKPKVGLKIPYYIDEGDFSVPIENKSNAYFNLNLSVAQSSGEHSDQVLENISRSDWILDICLDYFSTNNPFYRELQTQVSNDLRCNQSDTDIKADDICQIIVFIIKNLPYRCNLDDSLSEQELYDLKEDCWSAFSTAIISEDFLNIEKCFKNYPFYADGVIVFFRDHLRLLSSATRELILKSRHLLLLPHHPVHEEAEIDRLIADLKDFIIRYCIKKGKAPLCITLARSIDDGYTSPTQGDILQTKVLKMIREVMLAIFGVEQVIEHNLCEDPIVKAHDLFFSPATRKLFL